MRGHREHEWVGATEVRLTAEQALDAISRERMTVSAVATLVVLDVYCRRCRLSYTPERDAEGCSRGMILRGGPRLGE